MKSLIIKAHPAQYGFTHKIAEVYKESVECAGGDVVVIDLYKDAQYQQPFLSFKDDTYTGMTGREVCTRIQEKITWADELVFVYPTWWMNMPAIMKNFIDNNFTNGFAFAFKDGKMQGLLNDTHVRIFATGDGPTGVYFMMRPILGLVFNKGVFGFCGMKVKSFNIFADMVGNKNDAAREKMLDRVRARV